MFNNISEYIAYDALTAKVGVIVSKLDGSELPYVRYTQAYDRLPELFLELQDEAFGAYKNDATYKKRVVANYFHMINLRMIFSDDEERELLDRARQSVFPCYKKPEAVLVAQGSKNSSFVEKEYVQHVVQQVEYISIPSMTSCPDKEQDSLCIQEVGISENVVCVTESKDDSYYEEVNASVDIEKDMSHKFVESVRQESEKYLRGSSCEGVNIGTEGNDDSLSSCGKEVHEVVQYDGFLVIPSCREVDSSWGDSESSVTSLFKKFRRKLSDIFGMSIQKGRLLGGGKNGVKKLPVPFYDNFKNSLKGRRDVALRKKNNIARNRVFDYFVDEDSDDPLILEDNAHQYRGDLVSEESGEGNYLVNEDHNFVKDEFNVPHIGGENIWYWTGSFDANFGEEDDDVLNWSYRSNPYSVCDVRSKNGNEIDGFFVRKKRDCVVEMQVDIYLTSNVDFPFKLLVWCSPDNEPVGSLHNEDIQDIKDSCDFREYDVEPHGTVDVEDFVAIRQIFVDSGADERIGYVEKNNAIDYYIHVALHGSYYWPEYVADVQSYVALVMGEG